MCPAVGGFCGQEQGSIGGQAGTGLCTLGGEGAALIDLQHLVPAHAPASRWFWKHSCAEPCESAEPINGKGPQTRESASNKWLGNMACHLGLKILPVFKR